MGYLCLLLLSITQTSAKIRGCGSTCRSNFDYYFFLILCGGLLIVYNSLIHVVTVVLVVRFLFVLEVKFAVNLQFVNLTMPISL